MYANLATILALAGSIAFLHGNGSAANPENATIRGVGDYQVFPRDGGTGTIRFETRTAVRVTAEVIKEGEEKPIASQEWPEALAGDELEWVVREVRDVPVGGEYRLRIGISEGAVMEFRHLLVGEIWVVGGQSNALGSTGPPPEVIPQVHFFRFKGWQEGIDPFFPPAYPTKEKGIWVSMWLRAGQEYYRRTGIPVGLMGWAYGGVPMSAFWDKTGKEMVRFKSMVEEHGRGASTFLWYQGESDASPIGISRYKERLHATADALRRYSENPDLTMVVMQLSYGMGAKPSFGRMREVQRQFCIEDPRAVLVPAIPYPHRDFVHLNYDAVLMLGARITEALDDARRAEKPVWQGPRLVSAEFIDMARQRIRVVFDSAEKILVGAETGLPGFSKDPTHDWFVTDDKHQGYAEITQSAIVKGQLVIDVAGASIDVGNMDADEGKIRAPLVNTGYLRPTKVTVDGLSVVLELPEATVGETKVSYALFTTSRGSLSDEKGRPAATFADVGVPYPITGMD